MYINNINNYARRSHLGVRPRSQVTIHETYYDEYTIFGLRPQIDECQFIFPSHIHKEIQLTNYVLSCSKFCENFNEKY